jgi:hypothetical protein
VVQRHPAICLLGEAHGWDTPLYRADALRQPGLYAPQPVRVVDACRAALQSRAGHCRVYDADHIAVVAVDRPDPLYDAPGGHAARWALRQQLIAVEVLADDQ